MVEPDDDATQHVEASPEPHVVDAQSIVDGLGLSAPVYVPPLQSCASCVVIEEHFAFVEPDVAQHVEASPEPHEVDAQSIVDGLGLSAPVYVPPVQICASSCVVIEEHFAFVEPDDATTVQHSVSVHPSV